MRTNFFQETEGSPGEPHNPAHETLESEQGEEMKPPRKCRNLEASTGAVQE